MKQKGSRRKPSLKWELTAIVVMCWVLPVFAIVSVLGYYINSNINQQFVNTVTASVKSGAELAAVRLNSAVSASHRLNYNGAVKDAHYKYLKDGDVTSRYSETRAYLSQQYQYDDKFIAAMLFYCDDPQKICYTFNESYKGSFANVREYYGNMHERVLELYPKLGAGMTFLKDGDAVYMVRNVLDAGNGFAPYAVLIMELNTDVIFDGIKNVLWGTGAQVWLNDTGLELLGEPQDADILQAGQGEPYNFVEKKGGSVIYGTQELDACSFSYVISIDKISLVEELSSFNTLFLMLLLLIAPLLLLALWFFYRNISNPIYGLVAAAGTIEQGELGYQIDVDFDNREFQFLSQAFNSMSQKLKEQFERIYSEELALRDARIMALQSQINPHFLNNTLEIINWEARLADNIKVSRMIEALSTMLDAAMDRNAKPVVRLSEEMMYVDAYLYIIGERLGKRLVVSKEIDSELLQCFVPRLVLQPIIENAVEHGVQAQQQGEITIRVRREGSGLTLEIVNNGAMTRKDEEHIEKLLSPSYDAADENSSSLGIRNVNQRLKIIYGENSGLSIKTDSSGHVVAKIVIPDVQMEQ